MRKHHQHFHPGRRASTDVVNLPEAATQEAMDTTDRGVIDCVSTASVQLMSNVCQNKTSDIKGVGAKTTSYYPSLPQNRNYRPQHQRRSPINLNRDRNGHWGTSLEVPVEPRDSEMHNKQVVKDGQGMHSTPQGIHAATMMDVHKGDSDDQAISINHEVKFEAKPELLVKKQPCASVGVSKNREHVEHIPLVVDPWEIDPAELQLGECVGVGAAAEVFKASWHGTDVAVKKLRQQQCHKSSAELVTPGADLPTRLRRELSVLLELRHPNLVLFMGACTTRKPTLIVAEFCEGGTVFQLLYNQPSLRLSWSQRLKISLDTAKGMNFLHRRRVVHRDLKSLNLLLVSSVAASEDVPWVKISDFGLSRYLPSSDGCECAQVSSHVPVTASLMTGGLGTCLWMAPEVLSGSLNYNEKVDVYSFGMVLWELICRRVPFDGSGLEDPIAVAIAVSTGRRPDLKRVPSDCPWELRRTMEECWCHEPAARLSCDVILDRLKTLRDLPSGHSSVGDGCRRPASAHALRGRA